MVNSPKSIAIVVSGGPAPGINSVIAATTIEAEKRGFLVYGLDGGFAGLLDHGRDALLPLNTNQVSRWPSSGGSILGTARCNPLETPAKRDLFLEVLREKQISALIVIGGDGSAYLSHQLSLQTSLAIAHVPKTIDNDLLLPDNNPCFGFETARNVGVSVLQTLMIDAKTTRRWFVVSCMGRRAGFLALGLGIAANTTLTLIPEEFEGRQIDLKELVQIITSSVQSRLQQGKNYGVALLAEGIIDHLNPGSLPALAVDTLGRIKYADVELEQLLLPHLRQAFSTAPLINFSAKNIGYELRCHPPLAYDLEYTRFLGYGAIKLLAEGQSGFMVTRSQDNLGAVALQSLFNSQGQCRRRQVDLNSDLYKMARSFMIR